MAESNNGIRRLLSLPKAYELLQVAVGSNSSHRRFVNEELRLEPGVRVLDIGCGPGHILRALPEGVGYLGIDPSAEYIAAARRKWDGRGEFLCVGVENADLGDRRFDVAVSMGVLHHLDDEPAAALFRLVANALVAEGRFVAIDPVHSPEQGPVARWLIGRDRGENVRSAAEYERLAGPWFGEVTVKVRTDLLRVPYSHAMLHGAKPLPSPAPAA